MAKANQTAWLRSRPFFKRSQIKRAMRAKKQRQRQEQRLINLAKFIIDEV